MTNLRSLVLTSVVLSWTTIASAQLPSGELRLWLKADTLDLPEDEKVTQWIDSSPHGTIFAPRTASEPNGPFGGGPIEEFPHLETVLLNGRSFPTVKFERNGTAAGNPTIDRSGSAGRLFQVTNRTPGSDPLAIGDGTSVTSFTVFKPNVTTSGSLGVQAVWAKRGNDASLLELGIHNDGRLIYVTYDANTAYRVANPSTANAWQIVAQTITEGGANDSVQFHVNETQDAAAPLTLNPVLTNGGLIANRDDSINNDPAGVVEPFGIGGHAQDCCGEGEAFSGNIAEIIIYARTLSTAETNQVYSYLTSKYLGAMQFLGGDYNVDGVVDAGDYVVWRDNLGQFMGLPNENPEAASEGFVDEEDYEYWVANYGMKIAAAAAHIAVPEPQCAMLLLLAAALATRRRKQSSLRLLSLLAPCLLLSGASLEAAQLSLRYGGVGSGGGHEWFVLLQPDAASAAAVEIGFQFAGGSIVSLQPNAAVFDDLNPGQNPFTGSATIGVSIHNSGAAAFAALGGVIPEVVETRVMTIVTTAPGTLTLGGQNHNGFFTGARVWQGASPVNGLTASLHIAGTEADFDLDGAVDGRDLLQWQRGLGISSGAARANGDANADGTVDHTDLAIWKAQFGATTSIVAIPEPATIYGSVVMAAMAFRRRATSR